MTQIHHQMPQAPCCECPGASSPAAHHRLCGASHRCHSCDILRYARDGRHAGRDQRECHGETVDVGVTTGRHALDNLQRNHSNELMGVIMLDHGGSCFLIRHSQWRKVGAEWLVFVRIKKP